jgi:hypothetical protein
MPVLFEVDRFPKPAQNNLLFRLLGVFAINIFKKAKTDVARPRELVFHRSCP